MVRQLLNRNRKCKRCDMPLLSSDVNCPFCGRGQIAPYLPILHTVKLGAAIGALYVVGIPAGLVAAGSGFAALWYVLTMNLEAFFMYFCICIASATILRFTLWGLRKVTTG